MTTTENIVDSLHEMRDSLSRTTDPDAAAFTAAVVGRLATVPAPRLLRRRLWRRRVAALALTAGLIVAPQPRGAVARWLGVGSVRIERDSNRRVTALPAAIADLDLGTVASVEVASAELGRPIAVRRDRPPDRIWVQATPGTPSVTVNSVYLDNGSTILVSELPGPGNVVVNKKLMGQGSRLDFFSVRGSSAVWISGSPHEVLVQAANGYTSALPVRIAGAVLLWADDVRTLRIEGAKDRTAAIAVLAALI